MSHCNFIQLIDFICLQLSLIKALSGAAMLNFHCRSSEQRLHLNFLHLTLCDTLFSFDGAFMSLRW